MSINKKSLTFFLYLVTDCMVYDKRDGQVGILIAYNGASFNFEYSLNTHWLAMTGE